MASKSSKKNQKKKGDKSRLVKIKTSKKNKQTGTISDYSGGNIRNLETQRFNSKSVIGTFGSILIFEVSINKVTTFSDMNRTVSGRWATHEAINRKEKTEFIGAGLDSINMSITLDVGLGADPREMIKKLEKAIKQGTVERLIIGGKKVGTRKYRITEMTEAWDVVMRNGALYKATLDVAFEEYVG